MTRETPSISAQTQYYDERWGGAELLNLNCAERASHVLRAIAGYGKANPTILELGSGTGWMTGILAHFGSAVGIELSPRAVEISAKRYPNARFVAGDVFATPVEKEAYDIVVSSEVIEHVTDQAGYVAIAARALKPGGRLILTTPNGALWKMPDIQASFSPVFQPVENWLTPKALQELLTQDFQMISLHTIELGWGRAGWRRLMNSTKLVRVLTSLHLREPYDAVRSHLHGGLYLVAVAERRS